MTLVFGCVRMPVNILHDTVRSFVVVLSTQADAQWEVVVGVRWAITLVHHDADRGRLEQRHGNFQLNYSRTFPRSIH